MQPADPLVARFRADLEALTGTPGTFAVAVSGGPDSLALLLLARAAFPGAVHAATVDHGLRPESATEAATVADICRDLGVPHAILKVEVSAGGEGVQAAARLARYAALAEWMAADSLSLLLTAHHADDQAETLVMRLLRGSGVAGLAGVRALAPMPASDGALDVCRPLLGWRRAELAQIVGDAGLTPADDPSNRDEAYDRPRIRRLLAETLWLEPAALARSAAALADAEEALDATARALFDVGVEEQDGALLFSTEGVPIELRRRVTLMCLRRIAPGAAPRGEQITALVEVLQDGRTQTLAGVKCTGGDETWRFDVAPPRRPTAA